VNLSDIFISYSQVDRDKALMLAKALEREKWSVWWDSKIPPGKTFDDVIDTALANAKCALVLWSKTSVTSKWVKAEAAEANSRGVLLPVKIEDDVKIPLEFRSMHAARLSDWRGQPDHLEFGELKKAILALVGSSDLSPQKADDVAGVAHSEDVDVVPPPRPNPLREVVSEFNQREATEESKPTRPTSAAAVTADIVSAKESYDQPSLDRSNVSKQRKSSLLWILAATVGLIVIAALLMSRPESPPEVTQKPAEPSIPKFMGSVSSQTIFADPKTKLSWTTKDQGSDLHFAEAELYCNNLSWSGLHGWRLPTIDEVSGLYDPKETNTVNPGGGNIRKPFDLQDGVGTWSSSKGSISDSFIFYFHFGGIASVPTNGGWSRALCVRDSDK
jgi:hypothetical protein